ncbi:hypothetical protein C8T65DRAFT_830892 [Cerioporus squamosus]|nr:hypothetical protein C8T65DRAFT_830892 [Cerioporus squamosus]
MDPNEPQVRRDAHMYFPDGDVVLRAAGSDGVSHLFRVHKFLLKHHSMAFRDMFHAQDGSCSDTYDGAPVADMPGDRAEDLALLLSYLYNPSRLDPNKPVEVSGVIRLADKYLLEPLHDHLVQQVASDWPTTLHEWDIREAELQAIRKVSNQEEKQLWGRIPEPVAAILFAQEFGCPQLLPAAFYQLAQINFKHAYEVGDKPIDRYSLPWTTPVARWSLLEKDNLVRCMHGFQSIDDYYPDLCGLLSENCFPHWVDTPEDYEMLFKHSKCYAYLRKLLLLECLEHEKYPELSKEHFPDGLCEHCCESLPEKIARERKMLWDELPKYFMSQ